MESYGDSETIALRFIAAIKAVLKQLRPYGYCPGLLGVSRVNDDPRNSRELLAEIWAKAMRRLGYRKRGNVFIMAGRR